MFAAPWNFSAADSACLVLLHGCFVGATAVQLAVWILVFAKFEKTGTSPKGHHPGTHEDFPSLPPVSIIICARNEAGNLKTNLPRVLDQRYAGTFEVIVVDDASNDETSAVVRVYGRKYPRLRFLRLTDKRTPGKKEALAMGIAAARHEWLLLTDADCRPAGQQWLATMMQQGRSHPGVEVILGYAPMLPGSGILQAWARYEVAFTALQYVAFARIGRPYMGVGRNLAWKKALFATADGFSPHADLASGDDDLFVNAVARRTNTGICLAPASFVYSAAKPSWAGWWRQKRRHLSAGARYRAGHRILLGTIALTHTLHYGLGAILLLFGWSVPTVLLGYGIRMACASWVYAKAFRILCERPLLPLIPLWDGLLAVYYGLFVPLGLWLRRKPVDWD